MEARKISPLLSLILPISLLPTLKDKGKDAGSSSLYGSKERLRAQEHALHGETTPGSQSGLLEKESLTPACLAENAQWQVHLTKSNRGWNTEGSKSGMCAGLNSSRKDNDVRAWTDAEEGISLTKEP